MKLAIVGSRNFTDYEYLVESVCEIVKEPITLIISGGARGCDSLAEDFAKEFNIPFKVFLPDWKKYKQAAGMLRNKDIINASEKVIAFWNMVSPGTRNSIKLAQEQGKLLRIVEV